MSGPRPFLHPSPRLTLLVCAALLLAACAEQTPRPATTSGSPQQPQNQRASTGKPWKPLGPYTPGGLYAPGVADGAPEVPPDIARLPEPVPHPEPLSRYGNRSPYSVLGRNYSVLPSAAGYVERGMASWYGTKFDGRVTSSFEPYDLSQFTAAHKTLPLPSYARVTNLENGRSVIVRINDRGPFHEGRLIDLSYAAAIKLGVNVHGTAMVEVRGIDTSQPLPATTSEHIAATPAAPRPTLPRPKPVAPRPAAVAAVASLAATGSAGDDATADDDAATNVVVPSATASADDQPAAGGAPDSTPDPSSATTTPLPAPPAPAPVATLPPATPLPPASADATPPAATPTSLMAPSTAPAQPATTSPVAAPATATATRSAAAPAAALLAPATTIALAATLPLVPPVPSTGHPLADPTTRGFLQVASYGDRGNAERMMQRLQQAGIDRVELVSVQVADQTWWRVHVGPIRADEADQVAARLGELGFGTPPFFKE